MSILKVPGGLSPTMTLAVNGVALDYMAVNLVEHVMEPGLHEMLVITVAGLPPKATSGYRNQPVTCTMDLGGGFTSVFTGYVIDVQLGAKTVAGTLNGSPFQDVKLICLGVSYDMRGRNSRSWENHTLADVVEDRSTEYGFSYDVPSDPLTFQMFQDNESDWQFIVRYAKALGYQVTMNGTHLHVFDPYKAFTRHISYHRLQSPREVAQGLVPQPGQISKFEVTLAERHPDGSYKDTIVAVHQDDNTVYDVSLRELRGLTTPARFTNRLRDSAPTHERAVRAIDVEGKEHYDFHGKISCLGIPGCMPGGIVEVLDYGSSDTDGLWHVESVHHHLATGAFYTDLQVVRNINSELVPSAVQAFTAPPVPKLIGNRWLPTKRSTNVYA